MRYICGIDIGSSKVAACLAGFQGKELTRLWWETVAVSGVRRGQVQDVQALTGSIMHLLKKLKARSGIKIKSVYLGIASQNVITKHSQAVIALAERGNKSVTKAHIRHVNQQAQILASCLEDEVMHLEALDYVVDNENEVDNPLGLYGHRLKTSLYMVCARATYINTIIDIVHRLGLKLNHITLSALALSQAVFNPEKIRGLNIICDIGKDITQLLIFKDSKLLHCQILNCGGDDLTAKLCEELSISYSLAEEVKIAHGRIQDNLIDTADKEIIVKKGDVYDNLSQNSVTRILTRESRLMIEMIRDALQPHLLSASVAVIPVKATLYAGGRIACLDGFLELMELIMAVPVKMAKIGNSTLLAPLMHHKILAGEPSLNYLACLGLIIDAVKLPYKKHSPKGRNLQIFLSSLPLKLKEIYQDYF